MKVSILGPAGSYSEIAAKSLFSTICSSSAPQFLFNSSIENAVLRLFEEDENGLISNFAVIPVENSIEGAVGVSMDLLLEKDVSIIAEIILPVSHCLFVSEKTAQNPNFSPSQIRKIYSHPQGIFQCRSFIRSQLTNAETIETTALPKRLKSFPSRIPMTKSAPQFLQMLPEKNTDCMRFNLISNAAATIPQDLFCWCAPTFCRKFKTRRQMLISNFFPNISHKPEAAKFFTKHRLRLRRNMTAPARCFKYWTLFTNIKSI